MKKLCFLFLTYFSVSCSNTNNKQVVTDEFYTDKGDFDMGRIPLIKPYEATVPATGNADWIVSSTDDSLLMTMPGTKEVSVINNTILLHCINTIVNYQPVKEAWFVIIPKRQMLKSFQTHVSYQDYLKSEGFEKEPQLYPMDKVFRYYDEHDGIDWNKIK